MSGDALVKQGKAARTTHGREVECKTCEGNGYLVNPEDGSEHRCGCTPDTPMPEDPVKVGDRVRMTGTLTEIDDSDPELPFRVMVDGVLGTGLLWASQVELIAEALDEKSKAETVRSAVDRIADALRAGICCGSGSCLAHRVISDDAYKIAEVAVGALRAHEATIVAVGGGRSNTAGRTVAATPRSAGVGTEAG